MGSEMLKLNPGPLGAIRHCDDIVAVLCIQETKPASCINLGHPAKQTLKTTGIERLERERTHNGRTAYPSQVTPGPAVTPEQNLFPMLRTSVIEKVAHHAQTVRVSQKVTFQIRNYPEMTVSQWPDHRSGL